MKSAIVAELPPGRQHFFRIVCGCPRGFLDAENFGKLFLSFSERSLPKSNIQNSNQIECRNALSMCSEDNNRVTTPLFRNMALKFEGVYASALVRRV
jgi:hypothetical protein